MLLAGASGLVGSQVLHHLLQRGWEVVALSRHPGKAPVPPGVIQVVADVRGEGWARWCEGCRAAINLVGAIHRTPRDGTSPDEANLRTVEHLISGCKELGIDRLVHLSALAPTSTPPTPLQRSKLAGEELVRNSGLSFTILRPALIFGPGDHFSARIARTLRRRLVFLVPGDGAATFQPIAAAEVADAISSALEQPACEGLVLDVGGPERLSFNEIVRRTAGAIGVRRPLVHLPLGISRFLTRIAERLRVPPITGDELQTILTGSTCDNAHAAMLFGAPLQRYEGPTWLR